jgi:hypothetical protein
MLPGEIPLAGADPAAPGSSGGCQTEGVNEPLRPRRRILRAAAALPLASIVGLGAPASSAATSRSRVRPGDATWPSEATWSELRRRVGDALVAVRSPLQDCVAAPASPGARRSGRA